MKGGLAGLAGVMAKATPAAAEHGEATRPLDADRFEVIVGEYPNGPLIGDGDTVDFKKIRIEVFNVGVREWEPRDAATIHWRADVVYRHRNLDDPPDAPIRRLFESWKVTLFHQNNPPGGGLFNNVQAVHTAYKTQNGPQQLEVRIRTQDGQELTKIVNFKLALP